MTYAIPNDAGLTPDAFAAAVDSLHASTPALARLWRYYRNTLVPCATSDDNGSERPYRQAQEWGLPSRITGYCAGETAPSAARGAVARKEVVVENDIAWRVEAMIDHLFGTELYLASTAPDPARRAFLSRLAMALLNANGGLAFLQQLAQLGAVYGFVDVIVKIDPAAATRLRRTLADDTAWAHLTDAPAPFPVVQHESEFGATHPVPPPAEPSPPAHAPATPSPGGAGSAEGHVPGNDDPAGNPGQSDTPQSPTSPGNASQGLLIERLARLVRFEIVLPTRALPLPFSSAPGGAYAQVWNERKSRAASPATDRAEGERRRWWQRATRPQGDGRVTATPGHDTVERIELLTATGWWRLADGRVVDSGACSLNALPVVHIQNIATPFEYAGRSDVEPLIPLQDELNTRLSDRAYRITMQSFKMFLGKGIDNFLTAPVGPGRMWATDNDDAKVEEFGGDSACPSEESHISDIRDALDKTSGVPPVAAGTIRDKIGTLSSGAALRVTLQALMAKTERKRATYGQGLRDLISMSLAWLDAARLLPTTDDERHTEIAWPNILPDNTIDVLREAQIKAELGVPRETLLKEIGY